jgi:hypothetical protein
VFYDHRACHARWKPHRCTKGARRVPYGWCLSNLCARSLTSSSTFQSSSLDALVYIRVVITPMDTHTPCRPTYARTETPCRALPTRRTASCRGFLTEPGRNVHVLARSIGRNRLAVDAPYVPALQRGHLRVHHRAPDLSATVKASRSIHFCVMPPMLSIPSQRQGSLCQEPLFNVDSLLQMLQHAYLRDRMMSDSISGESIVCISSLANGKREVKSRP